jgi:hypothetical protein
MAADITDVLALIRTRPKTRIIRSPSIFRLLCLIGLVFVVVNVFAAFLAVGGSVG